MKIRTLDSDLADLVERYKLSACIFIAKDIEGNKEHHRIQIMGTAHETIILKEILNINIAQLVQKTFMDKCP